MYHVHLMCTQNLMIVNLQAQDKGASSLETGMIIGIASLTLTIFAPAVGYFVSFVIIVITSIAHTTYSHNLT